jgi:phosphatidate cytidylyltransferase
MLLTRVLSAAVLLPIVAVGLYLGGPVMLALLALVATLAGYEFLALARAKSYRPSLIVGLGLVVALVADGGWPQLGLLPVALLVFPLAGLACEVFRGNAPGSLESWALTVVGGLYIGLPLSCVARLRALDGGMMWLTLALVSTWISDSGAYFVGVNLGKRRFFPKISPKKTLEGAIGGWITAELAVMLLGRWWVGLPWGQGLLLGALLFLAATLGDLAESVIKRQVGVKDSGHLIPGHGGMLDRVDSLLFVVPMVYYFARWVMGV